MNLNKVQLIGRAGRDPEYKALSNYNAVTKFSLATSEKYKKDGEVQEATEWHNVVCWGKLADIVSQFVKKGQLVYVEGKIKTETWEKDGEKKYRTTVVASNVIFLGFNEAKAEAAGGGDQGDGEDVPF